MCIGEARICLQWVIMVNLFAFRSLLSPINNGRLCSSGYLSCSYPSSIYSALVLNIMIEFKACMQLDLMKNRQPEGLNYWGRQLIRGGWWICKAYEWTKHISTLNADFWVNSGKRVFHWSNVLEKRKNRLTDKLVSNLFLPPFPAWQSPPGLFRFSLICFTHIQQVCEGEAAFVLYELRLISRWDFYCALRSNQPENALLKADEWYS